MYEIVNALSDNVMGSFKFEATVTNESLNTSTKTVSFIINGFPSLIYIFDSQESALQLVLSSLNIFRKDLGSDLPSSILD